MPRQVSCFVAQYSAWIYDWIYSPSHPHPFLPAKQRAINLQRRNVGVGELFHYSSLQFQHFIAVFTYLIFSVLPSANELIACHHFGVGLFARPCSLGLILTATSRRMGCRMKVLAPAARGLSFNGATSAPATSRRRQRVNHHWEPHQPAPCWSCSSVGGWDRAISVLVPCVQFHGGFAFEWGYGCNPVL